MRRSIWLATMGAILAAATMVQPAAAENSQQTKMTTCNADAKTKGLTGSDRKAFMKTCLSNKPAKQMTQGEKMSMCNKKTAGLDKEARAKAQSECMKAN